MHYRPGVTPPLPPPPDTSAPHRDGVLRNAAHGPLPALLLALTVVAGAIDAVSILVLGRVFVANMTGNVVFAGFAIVGVPGFALGSSLVALAGFLAGAAVGGRLAARFHGDRAVLLLAACVLEVPLSAAALVIAAAGADLNASGGRYSLSILLAVAMGIQNASVRRLAVPDLTTTVLTMTLTGIAADVRHGEWRKPPLRRRFLAVAAMLGGAVAGAELVFHHGATSDLVLVTAILAAVTVGTVAVVARDHGKWRQGA
jgi:uncharacterized membrane protein YoaK (UPF0700 family)